MSLPFHVVALTLLLSAATNGHGAVAQSPRLPFTFVENRGETDQPARYLGTGPEFKAWFRETGVVLQRGATATEFNFERHGEPGPVRVEADHPLSGRASYLIGSKPEEW